MKLSFDEYMKINNNILECQKCFRIILVFNGKINNKNCDACYKFNIEFGEFGSLLSYCKEEYDKLNEII